MKPRRFILEQEPSAVHGCPKCGEPMRLSTEPNPFRWMPWESLIVFRCEAGHILRVRGVVAEPSIEAVGLG